METIEQKRNKRGGSIASAKSVARSVVTTNDVLTLSQAPVVESHFEALDRGDVPNTELRQFDRYVAEGIRPRTAAFYAGIGSGRISGDTDVDFSLIDPALKGEPLLR